MGGRAYEESETSLRNTDERGTAGIERLPTEALPDILSVGGGEHGRDEHEIHSDVQRKTVHEDADRDAREHSLFPLIHEHAGWELRGGIHLEEGMGEPLVFCDNQPTGNADTAGGERSGVPAFAH